MPTPPAFEKCALQMLESRGSSTANFHPRIIRDARYFQRRGRFKMKLFLWSPTSVVGQTETCWIDRAMSASPPIPEAVDTSRTVALGGCQLSRPAVKLAAFNSTHRQSRRRRPRSDRVHRRSRFRSPRQPDGPSICRSGFPQVC